MLLVKSKTIENVWKTVPLKHRQSSGTWCWFPAYTNTRDAWVTCDDVHAVKRSNPRPDSSEDQVKPINLGWEREGERLTASEGPLHLNEALDPQTGSFMCTSTANIWSKMRVQCKSAVQTLDAHPLFALRHFKWHWDETRRKKDTVRVH